MGKRKKMQSKPKHRKAKPFDYKKQEQKRLRRERKAAAKRTISLGGNALTQHHLKNKCRFKSGATPSEMDFENTVVLPKRFHASLHAVFGNLSPREMVVFLNCVLVHGEEWTKEELEALRVDIMTKG